MENSYIDIFLLIIGVMTGGTYLLPPKIAKFTNIIGTVSKTLVVISDGLEKSRAGISMSKD